MSSNELSVVIINLLDDSHRSFVFVNLFYIESVALYTTFDRSIVSASTIGKFIPAGKTALIARAVCQW